MRSGTDVTILQTPIEDHIALPDEEAAILLNARIRAWDEVERLAPLAYVERGRIAVEFEKRGLWMYLTDPETGEPFTSWNRWMSSGAIGGRSTNFEAKRDVEALADVPAEQLQGVPKSSLKVLKQLSTSVRQNPEVLEAAKSLKSYQLANQVAQAFPDQHIEEEHIVRLKLTVGAQGALEEAIDTVMGYEMAGTRSEAVQRIAEIALEQVKLQREIEEIETR